MRYELIVNIGGTYSYVDTFNPEDIATSLNFNISDIKDITTKNSSYSKTIKVPDTKVNRQTFQYISEISSQSTFDPTKKARCWVLKDTVIQFEGNFQMTELEYDRDLNADAYYLTIYQDVATIIDNIGEKYLADLSLSQYDTTWNFRQITESWTSDYTNGVYYPLIDYGHNVDQKRLIYGGLSVISEYAYGQFYVPYGFGIDTRYFYPGVYLKPVFDQMFLEAGGSYQSDFLNSDFFKNLIIPFNNKVLQSYFFPNGTASGTTSSTLFISELSHNVPAQLFTLFALWNSFDVDTNLYDPNNLYDTATYSYNNTFTEGISQNFTINFSIDMGGFSPDPTINDIYLFVARGQDPITGQYTFFDNFPADLNLYGDLWNGYQGSGAYGFGGEINQGQIPVLPVVPFGGKRYYSILNGWNGGDGPISITPTGLFSYNISGTVSTDYLDAFPLRPGEQVKFFFMYVNFQLNANLNTMTLKAGTRISSDIVFLKPVYGSVLHIQDILPQNVKQKDLLYSIIKMFNLYLEPIPGQVNAFIIEPRDDYYNKYQVIKDWSQKLDLSQLVTSEITSNTQKRINKFTYKADSDLYNDDYTKTTNQIYGQYEWDIDNDFITDQNVIDTIFSPTPIDRLPGTKNIYLPIIEKLNNGNIVATDGMNIRLLYKNYLPLTGNDKFYLHNFENGQGETQSFYPYVGPFDNPIGASVSLNFGQVESYYFPFTDAIDNIFYTYWQNIMNEISDPFSRIVTCYLNLTSNDISQFKFSDLILMKFDGSDQYYRINKIFDYDPSKNQPTKVELIKAIDYIIPKNRNLILQSQSNPNTPLHNIIVNGNISQSPTNINLQSTGGMGNILNGQYNVVDGGQNIMISGSNNSNSGSNGAVIGNGNNIGG